MAASDVVDRIVLAPDAGLVRSLGANHTLESAIADLVDNSVDADATRVSIRLLTDLDRLVQVEVVDDGGGMNSETVNAAMTIGHQREYDEADLGHFGMGLKAASFGHCDVLTVWSRQQAAEPVGRRIRRADFSKDFTCEVLAKTVAARQATARRKVVGGVQGTTVVWSEIRNAYRGRNAEEAREWLALRESALRAHLGVTFHRLLAAGRLQIDIVVDDVAAGSTSPGVPVLPIDPFSYARSGHPDYPKALFTQSAHTKIKLTCHIWPAKTDKTGFRIGDKPGGQLQGFYIYRNDRLLQVGGWADTANPAPARQLARVVVDDDSIGKLLTMNPEKSGLKFEPTFHDALGAATADDGTTFAQYLEDAESIFTTANKRKRRRKPAIRPERGFAPELRRRIGSELTFISGDPVNVLWRRLPVGEFFDVNLRTKTLLLNTRYRHLFAPGGGSLNDAPFLKALMYLLTHELFEGQALGSSKKDDLALWKSVLGAAVLTETINRGG
ncbi:hypothetical protein PSU4_37370 [Pseudonocardia sulfidoxydans NBRC 16205]|uniref:ATPase n=2 Tax=Pseudonocardia sulfidoxydans TaxID=54011 RepID=A0A511DKH8_9PSEU|nr:hypothetical protein PSU4_37370 [Pseudonocardia sulfidoxydans NBRC 16205]